MYFKCVISTILIGLLITSCKIPKNDFVVNSNSLNSERLQKIIDNSKNTIYLGAGTIYLDKPIYLRSNTHIVGEYTKITFDQSQNINFIRANNQSNISLKNLVIQPKNKIWKEGHNPGYHSIKMLNVSGFRMENVEFKDQLNTPVVLYDVKDVLINNCTFANIGTETKGRKYSYDGIFLGAYNEGTKGVVISDCQFSYIGTNESKIEFSNDGDGIQIYTKSSTIDKVQISNCRFENISRRGIKLQSGSNIQMLNNTFNYCKIALGISMENSTSGILFDKNIIKNGDQGININSRKDKPCEVNDFKVKKNTFSKLYGVLRTSGTSSIKNGELSNNIIKSIETYVFSGKISHTQITKNRIEDFQIKPIEKSNAAIYIWNGSNNTIISENEFFSENENVLDVYLYINTSNITVEKNKSFLSKRSRITKTRNRSNNNIIKK